jgi:ATP-dependent Clp protease ATP-binding subunit ClpA
MLSIKKIVIKFTEDVRKSLLEKHNITLNLSEPVIDYLAEKGYDSKMGARPLSRKIDELIRVPISKKILFERIKDSSILAVMENDAIGFVVSAKKKAKINDQGIIELVDDAN